MADQSVAKPVESTRRWGGFTRAFDVLAAAAGLALILPLFAAVALAIKLDDGGPIFYAQPRAGRNFRTIRVIKFRSMVANADQNGLLTAPADSRVTRVGRFLREYKLDELPQLWNVLRGDMQLVGARPEVERYVEMFRSEYTLILQERPGITDPAALAYRHEDELFGSPDSRQAQGPTQTENSAQTEEIERKYLSSLLPDKLRLSLAYRQRRSFFSDLRILLRTVAGLSN
jgi:lipopolysaccharide/colanic/teichoic acid biosynthesis glycosyltransferase